MFDPFLTRGEALAAVRRAFREGGIADPALDARVLLAAAASVEAVVLLSQPEAALGPEAAGRLAGFVRRRLDREPVARIVGSREFWGLPFRISPATLEPRPDTETVVEAALGLRPDRSGTLRILDLGTGTGCILVALLSERPAWFGLGTDRSAAALATARANAIRNGVADRAVFAASHWADAIGGRFDLVLSNPPYIETTAVAGLAPEVARHDPAAALDGGPDGLAAYRAILADLPRLLAPSGAAVLEIGSDQAEALRRLADEGSVSCRTILRDLAGRDRVAVLAPT